MKILVTGATGFIGKALAVRLLRGGHQVVACVHRSTNQYLPPGVDVIAVDFMRDTDEDAWLARLVGVDAVINAVGILRETRHASFAFLHYRAPQALFRACHTLGVKRVIQISALGADGQAQSKYHRSKKAADDALRGSDLDWTIVQPSVIFGSGGASTSLFLRLTSMPLVPLIGNGEQRMQPLHIDDLSVLVMILLEQRQAIKQTIAAVGPTPVTMCEMLSTYRKLLHLGPARFVKIPLMFMRGVARIGDILHAGALSTETLNMLLRGNTASAQAITAILGYAPRPLHDFIPPQDAPTNRLRAQWAWLRLPLLASIAIMWFAAGMVSWFYARDEGLALLANLGFSPRIAALVFMSACGLNIALGLATLFKPRSWLWLLQLGTVVFYTGALTLLAPGLWSDPFGPLVKNLPLAALLLTLAITETRD